ncbi:hypothetical protein LCGC14_2059730 [marine sediment metagenome]|uniref:Uncharacterized protein n=1 Tax=marine sediment metagenome TaxID=412755 RepID=A0A0F9ELM1_9ZZZZ
MDESESLTGIILGIILVLLLLGVGVYILVFYMTR